VRETRRDYIFIKFLISILYKILEFNLHARFDERTKKLLYNKILL